MSTAVFRLGIGMESYRLMTSLRNLGWLQIHPGFPVMKLMINHYAFAKMGKLFVASIVGTIS